MPLNRLGMGLGLGSQAAQAARNVAPTLPPAQSMTPGAFINSNGPRQSMTPGAFINEA